MKFATIFLLAAILTGCMVNSGPLTPRDQLAVAVIGFNETVTTVASLRALGLFSPAETTEIDALILEGSSLLDQWHDIILAAEANGQPANTRDIQAAFQRTLIELQAARTAAQRRR